MFVKIRLSLLVGIAGCILQGTSSACIIDKDTKGFSAVCLTDFLNIVACSHKLKLDSICKFVQNIGINMAPGFLHVSVYLNNLIRTVLFLKYRIKFSWQF